MPTLEQIQAKLKKLQAQADVLIARKAQVAVDQIRDLMLKHGLTTADIEAKAKARRAARGLNGLGGNGKAKSLSAGKASPKYRDHKTGATWTGHGRAPAWIANVKDRTQFLVEGASELKSVAKAALAPGKRSKGQPKGAQPAKYLDPKTGATWSGRGPAPQWLASVKDRTKYLIDQASSATSGTVARKAAAKKVVAKKAGAAKKAVVKKAATATRKVAKKVAKTATKTAAKTSASAAAKKVTAKTASRPAAKKSAPVKAARKAAAKKSTANVVSTTAAAAPQPSTPQTSA